MYILSLSLILSVILLCLIIIFIITKYFTQFNNIYNSSFKYYKCDKLNNNNPTNLTLAKNNFKRTANNTQWDMYIPCGYTDVERELLDLNLQTKPATQITQSNQTNNTNKTNSTNKTNHANSTKSIFAIDGCDTLASKDILWSKLETMYGRQIAKSLMPETYLTSSANDMSLFKINYSSNIINTPNNIYIIKKNIQDKKGILLLTDIQDIIETVYKQDFKVIQHYIQNPLLINKHKINLRLYIAVVCNPINGKHVYLYNNGKCIYTNREYTGDDITQIDAHITSVNLDVKIYNTLPEWMIPDLQMFIGFAKYRAIWLKICAKLKMIAKSVISDLCTNENTRDFTMFQLFGVDIIVDDKFDPLVLEFNKGPDMTYKTDKDQQLKEQLFDDLFNLVNVGKISNSPPEKSNMVNNNKVNSNMYSTHNFTVLI